MTLREIVEWVGACRSGRDPLDVGVTGITFNDLTLYNNRRLHFGPSDEELKTRKLDRDRLAEEASVAIIKLRNAQ